MELPSEIWQMIFNYLPLLDLSLINSTSRRFRTLLDKRYWKTRAINGRETSIPVHLLDHLSKPLIYCVLKLSYRELERGMEKLIDPVLCALSAIKNNNPQLLDYYLKRIEYKESLFYILADNSSMHYHHACFMTLVRNFPVPPKFRTKPTLMPIKFLSGFTKEEIGEINKKCPNLITLLMRRIASKYPHDTSILNKIPQKDKMLAFDCYESIKEIEENLSCDLNVSQWAKYRLQYLKDPSHAHLCTFHLVGWTTFEDYYSDFISKLTKTPLNLDKADSLICIDFLTQEACLLDQSEEDD